MLDDAGRFDFFGELADLAEQLWCAYEQRGEGPVGHLERQAGLMYILAALRQDLDALCSALSEVPELTGAMASACLTQYLGPLDEETVARARAEARRRGWIRSQPAQVVGSS